MKLYKQYPLASILEQLQEGKPSILSRCITLLESTLEEDRHFIQELFEHLPATSNSIRIGITGVPGAGKSTFINTFGHFLLEQETHSKLAVLAIDPSSSKTQGSILGDKTRMPLLLSHPRAFIRPSPNKGLLGGVNAYTYETLLLCEASGYNRIIVETVGVGQSEGLVKDVTDLLIWLTVPHTGDELQGIKKGIMELVDLIILNKADTIDSNLLQRTGQDLKNALHLLPLSKPYWQIPLITSSGLSPLNFEAIYEHIIRYMDLSQKAGDFQLQRHQQLQIAFHQQFRYQLLQKAYQNHASLIETTAKTTSSQDFFAQIQKLVERLLPN